MLKKIGGLGVPLFFVLPVAGFCTSLFNLKSKSGAFVYLAFAMLFGYAISFTDSSADSYRYAEAFRRFDNTLNYNTIVELYKSGELRDLYRLLLYYFVSLFTNNPKIMYAVAGLVYGIFSYLSLRIFVKERGNKLDIYVFILALVFFTYASLANINGFRFNTGAMVLFYATYRSVIEGHKRWIIGIIITPLFHYGFILIVPILLLYNLTKSLLYNSEKVSSILFYLFILSFLASWFLNTNVINLGFLSTELISGAAGDRISYVNSSEVAALVDNRRDSSLFLGVQQYFNSAIKIFVFIAVIFIRKELNKMAGDKTVYTRLLSFVLFFYFVSFIATSFPSGGRFLYIAHLFLFVLIGKFYAIYKKKNMKTLVLWALPAFSFNIVFINFMLPALILSPTFWYGNFFWILIEGLDFHV